MAGLIKQSVKFPASASTLYKMYMDEKLHAAATGQKAKITAKDGGAFSVSNGMIKGKILAAKAGKMVVQTWRGNDWDKTDADSILILSFVEVSEGNGSVELVHANVPVKQLEPIKKGWSEFYWQPWKKYIADSKKPAAAKKAKVAKKGTAAKKPSAEKPAAAKKATAKKPAAKKPAVKKPAVVK